MGSAVGSRAWIGHLYVCGDNFVSRCVISTSGYAMIRHASTATFTEPAEPCDSGAQVHIFANYRKQEHLLPWSRFTAASLNSLVNILLDNPMSQFSFGWILSLNQLCQKGGQAHRHLPAPSAPPAALPMKTFTITTLFENLLPVSNRN